MTSSLLQLGPRITILPVIHGSGDFATQVRQTMLSEKFDCLAVPLPPSFQNQVEAAIDFLPGVTVVTQLEPLSHVASVDWTPETDLDDSPEPARRTLSYVPLDPCQAVIAALRIALQEHIPRAFIDLETSHFQPVTQGLPDAYALKRLSVENRDSALKGGAVHVMAGE